MYVTSLTVLYNWTFTHFLHPTNIYTTISPLASTVQVLWDVIIYYTLSTYVYMYAVVRILATQIENVTSAK